MPIKRWGISVACTNLGRGGRVLSAVYLSGSTGTRVKRVRLNFGDHGLRRRLRHLGLQRQRVVPYVMAPAPGGPWADEVMLPALRWAGVGKTYSDTL